MQITKALLIKFLENRCSREESEMVYQYLLQNPQAIDELLSDEEWEAFETAVAIEKTRSNEWFSAIQKQKQPKSTRVMWMRWVSAAAAVILAVSLIMHQFMQPAGKKNNRQARQFPVTITKVVPEQKRFINNGSTPVTYTLDDSSVITLYKNSIIECNQPFGTDKRNIVLHGEALFRVAKDKHRPFTVFTDNFSTTALGTVFKVSARNNSSVSNVQLMSGKVVVKNLRSVADPVYLSPGDECSFNTAAKILQLHPSRGERPATKPVVPRARGTEAPVTETEDVVIFKNAPLQQVFNTISSIYHVSIHAETVNLENRKFSGTFLKNESPDELLSTIAGLNNWHMIKDGTMYQLSY